MLTRSAPIYLIGVLSTLEGPNKRPNTPPGRRTYLDTANFASPEEYKEVTKDKDLYISWRAGMGMKCMYCKVKVHSYLCYHTSLVYYSLILLYTMYLLCYLLTYIRYPHFYIVLYFPYYIRLYYLRYFMSRLSFYVMSIFISGYDNLHQLLYFCQVISPMSSTVLTLVISLMLFYCSLLYIAYIVIVLYIHMLLLHCYVVVIYYVHCF